MLGRLLLACLIGLGCGVAHGAYLLLVLRIASAARGAWRKFVVLSWALHVAWPGVLVTFVALPPFVRPDSAFLGFVFCYVLPWSGALVWYMRTHPSPLQIDWGRGNERGGRNSVPIPSVTELPAVGVKGDRSGRVPYSYAVTAASSGVLALYLVLSRRAFLHYYLAATGCGLGLAVYVLLLLHALRHARGAWRRVLLLLWPSGMVLYFAVGIAFRVVGRRLGLAGDLAAELGVPFLLGVPLVWVALWYAHRYAPPGSRQAAGRGA